MLLSPSLMVGRFSCSSYIDFVTYLDIYMSTYMLRASQVVSKTYFPIRCYWVSQYHSHGIQGEVLLHLELTCWPGAGGGEIQHMP